MDARILRHPDLLPAWLKHTLQNGIRLAHKDSNTFRDEFEFKNDSTILMDLKTKRTRYHRLSSN